MNNGIGKAKERELTPEVVASLHSHEVMAVLFAEVGAQGRPEYASVISRSKEGAVFVDSGSFCFDYNGKKYGSGIEIELLERLVPFLKCMRGDSLEVKKTQGLYRRTGMGKTMGWRNQTWPESLAAVHSTISRDRFSERMNMGRSCRHESRVGRFQAEVGRTRRAGGGMCCVLQSRWLEGCHWV